MLKLFRRIQYLLRHRRIDQELAQEVELHRAMEAERLERAGLDPARARAASLRAMGNVTLAREDARSVWVAPWLEGAGRDISYASRVVVQRPGFAAAMTLVMGLGIGATTGVFGLLDRLVIQSLPVREPDRLVFLKNPAFSYPIFSEVRARGSRLFAGLFAWNIDRLSVQWSGALEPTDVLMVSGEFYSTLGVSAGVGSVFGQSDDLIGGGDRGLVAVISDRCWRRRFAADPGVVGKQVRVNQRIYTIVGVTPPGFFGVSAGLAPDLMIPLTTLQDEETLRSASSAWLHVMGRLADGITLPQANATFTPVWHAVLEATTNADMPADRRAMYLGRQTTLVSARTGFSRVRNQFQEPLWMLFGLVGLLLAVACASAANMLLARGVARRREIAVRLAIGASRARLIRQMLTEALIWTVLGAGTGLLIAAWGSGLLVRMMATSAEAIVLDVTTDARVLSMTVVLTLFSTMVSAAVPALRATRLNAGSELKSQPGVGGVLRLWSFGKTLVAIQIALTVLLLIAAALFSRSLDRILARDAGFNGEGVLVVWTDALAAGYDGQKLLTFYQTLLERLRQAPSVESASLSWYPPISDDNGSWTQSVAVDGVPTEDRHERQVYFNAISPGYIRTMGMRLLRGRDFTDRDTNASTRVVLINESLARKIFGAGMAIGRRFTIGRNASRRDLEVIGIVQDAKYQRLQEPSHSIAYLPCAQLAELLKGTNLVAEVRTVPGIDVRTAVTQEVRSLDGMVPLRLETVADRIAESLVKERVLAMLAGILGLAALALACAAVYGLMAYTVSRQTREIGLRIALGAAPASVLRRVLRDSVAIALLGLVIALPAVSALGRFVRTLLFEVTPLDITSILGSSLLIITVAALAGLLPARRASLVDPALALKAE